MVSDSPFTPPNPDSSPVDESSTQSQSIDNSPRKNMIWVLGSWLLILSMVACIAGFVSYSQFFVPRSFETSAAELMQFNLSAKMMVGIRQPAEPTLKGLEHFETGPLEQRYSHAIMVNEFAGAEQAIDQLETIDEAVAVEIKAHDRTEQAHEFPSESQLEIRRVLGQLFEQYESEDFDSSELPQEDRKLLTEKLGWVGQLALTPRKSPNKSERKKLDDEASRAFMIAVMAMIFGLLAILAAFVALAMLAGLLFARQLDVRFKNYIGRGHVYIETFAIWILFFFGLQIGLGLAASFINNSKVAMALTPLAFFGSLIALAWPIARGIPFTSMCHDIGWEIRNPFEEIFVGGFSYLALLVPMLFGISITILLGAGMSLINSPGDFESVGPAGHPIAEEIASGDAMVWIFVVVSACIAAPIVEETMFRGVLYRSLRDSTSRHAKWLSVTLSALTGGLIFAMIHPQGIVGVPVLTTLAIGFSLVREWRNSLIGPIVMHAINNGIVTCILLLLFS